MLRAAEQAATQAAQSYHAVSGTGQSGPLGRAELPSMHALSLRLLHTPPLDPKRGVGLPRMHSSVIIA